MLGSLPLCAGYLVVWQGFLFLPGLGACCSVFFYFFISNGAICVAGFVFDVLD